MLDKMLIKNMYTLEETIAAEIFDGLNYPWEALPLIIENLQSKGNVVFLPITDSTKQVYHVKEKDAPVVDEDPEPVDEEETTIEEKSETEADPNEE